MDLAEQVMLESPALIERTLVSIVIITWNRRGDVLEAIQSAYQQPYPNFEIIVVDNGSSDGTVEAVTKAFAQVRVIALESNVGVSRARNAALDIVRGDIIFCLDSDASLARDTLGNVVRKFRAEPRIGVTNSKIVNAFTGKIDDIAGWSYSDDDRAFQNTEFLSFSFSEGGAAIRRQVLDKVGFFWNRLFFGYEGMEFSLRVLDAGYDILYFPSSLIYHRASPHSRIAAGERERMLFHHCLAVYLVRFPWWLFAFFAPLKIAATVLRSARRGYFIQILLAFGDLLRQTPSLLRERKPIRNSTAWAYLKLQREHGPLRWNILTWLRNKT